MEYLITENKLLRDIDNKLIKDINYYTPQQISVDPSLTKSDIITTFYIELLTLNEISL